MRLTEEQLESLDVDQLQELEFLVELEWQAKRYERCTIDPLFWLQQHTKTENPHYMHQGKEFKEAFPQKSYFRVLFNLFLTEDHLFLPKSREMVTSWSVMGYACWRAMFYRWEVVAQSQKEAKAFGLVKYASILFENSSEFIKQRHSLKRKVSGEEISFSDGGLVHGVPAGADQIRSFHPTLYIMDEAAFLSEAQASYNAAYPVARQIIVVSSAGPGWFANTISKGRS
jgi:hypothetical protein